MEMKNNMDADLVNGIAQTVAELDNLDIGYSTPDDMKVIARGIKFTLLALASGMGECQREVPFAPLHPVIRPDGTLVWCCNHDPNHCA